MGFRRWLLFLVCLVVPIVLLAAGLRVAQGPYTLACQARHDGFAIIYTREYSNNSKAFSIPFGECPDRLIPGRA